MAKHILIIIFLFILSSSPFIEYFFRIINLLDHHFLKNDVMIWGATTNIILHTLAPCKTNLSRPSSCLCTSPQLKYFNLLDLLLTKMTDGSMCVYWFSNLFYLTFSIELFLIYLKSVQNRLLMLLLRQLEVIIEQRTRSSNAAQNFKIFFYIYIIESIY